MSEQIDKSKTCLNCPDRWVKDGRSCHSVCPEYLARKARGEALRQKRLEIVTARRDADNFLSENMDRTRKRKKRKKHGQR